MWTLILGDNGAGKTTVLRSIAMGLVDKTSASGLLSELYGEWVRYQAGETAKATIHIEFEREKDRGVSRWIETTVERTKSGDSIVEQSTFPEKPEEFPWGNIFVCGYGAARRAYGSQDYPRYSQVDSVYTLFNYDAFLQNPELVFRRIQSEKEEVLDKILSWICKVLMLPEESLRLSMEGIMIKGFPGKLVSIHGWGDGHHATLAWLADMIGWATFYDISAFENEVSGIILLDEIEQHLHASWQKQVIKILHEQFPRLQFITTTHSPLCAIGSASLPDEDCSLFLLEQEDDYVKASRRLRPPRGRRADQVLTSYLFGLASTRSDDFTQSIERYSALLAKDKRSEKEESELAELRKKLNEELGSAETPLQQLVGEAVRKALDKLVSERGMGEILPSEGIDFEIKRQIRDILGEQKA